MIFPTGAPIYRFTKSECYSITRKSAGKFKTVKKKFMVTYLPKGVRRFIRAEKGRIRRQVTDAKVQLKLIEELKQRFTKKIKTVKTNA
jgi:hypothetical protein